MKFIHQLKKWPEFEWEVSAVNALLATVRHRQGRFIGKMEELGFQLRAEAVLQTLTEETVKSSEIEGERLDRTQVRSSLARRLGVDVGAVAPADRNVEGVVEMTLDATQNFERRLTAERLFGWHTALFPTGHSGKAKIRVGNWRDDSHGPMQVVSGPIGNEHVHFEAPAAARLNKEMRAFLNWFNSQKANKPLDPVLRAAIAHLWFVTIHPFEDGNGRIARAIADLALVRSERSSQRFYSMSAQICLERKDYYNILEAVQRGTLDITPWLIWFLECLDRAFVGAEVTLKGVLTRAKFWKIHDQEPFNERQRKILGLLLDRFEGKLTSSKWALICKCSQDTASRDIEDLIQRGILLKSASGGRSTSYTLHVPLASPERGLETGLDTFRPLRLVKKSISFK